MATFRELFRTAEYEVGKKRKLTREFVITLDDTTLTGSPFAEPSLLGFDMDLAKVHPTYANYKVRKLIVTEGFEGSPYHVHVKAEYDVILAEELLSPTARAAVWTATSSPGQVPALTYYDGTTLKPLVNSAGDYFEGLTAEESLVVMTVTKNLTTWPSSWYALQNNVNNAAFAGCAAGSIKVVRVTTEEGEEEWNGTVVRFWKTSAELHYRQSGHAYQLPDVGWNVLSGGQKQRAMVFDNQNSEWIPSANPIALNGSGAAAAQPSILARRVNPEADFASVFGAVPTTPRAV